MKGFVYSDMYDDFYKEDDEYGYSYNSLKNSGNLSMISKAIRHESKLNFRSRVIDRYCNNLCPYQGEECKDMKGSNVCVLTVLCD